MTPSPSMIPERVREIMAGLFAVDPASIRPESSIGSIERWDSLNHVNLIMSLEQEFGLKIKPLDAAGMVSFDEVCQTLARYLG